jgi:L-aspartate oxidase
MSVERSVRRLSVDVLIVGGGIAGYQTALNLLPMASVALVSKGSIASGSSYYAQGGLAIPWGFDRESIDSHVADTVRAGAGLCDVDRVRTLIEGAEEAFATLVSYGVPFDRDKNGQLLVTREAAHSTPRIVHAGGDKTGSLIVKTLAQNVHGHERFTFLTPFQLYRLMKDPSGRAVGGLFLGENGQDWLEIEAKATILATGGFSALFARTTNPPSQVGDAMAVCHRAGAELERLAFTQFHPTVLDIPGQPPFLLTEALRGEGGHVINSRGERILFKYHPDGELAPRDVVSRALWLEIREHPEWSVFLSVTHLRKEYLRDRFPQVYNHCLGLGIDLSVSPAPIRPAAHFQMGGITTDMEGRSSVPGLFAVGEVASTRVHGANRLASNSLLEALVMGHRVVRALTGTPDPLKERPGSPLRQDREIPEALLTVPAGTVGMREIRDLLWNDAGIVRNAPDVQAAQGRIASALTGFREVPVTVEGFLIRNALELSRDIFSDLLTAPRVGANFFSDAKRSGDG